MIELLAVVAIIGVLVGLLLPSVQRSRETARSTSCKNNLLNLQLGVEAYHAAFRVYPIGSMTDRLPVRMFPDGKDHSWLVQVRPFFAGGHEFAERWSPNLSAYHPDNWSTATMGPAFFSCPSSPFMHGRVVPLSYAGVHDGRDAVIDSRSRGAFAANRSLRRKDIADGLAHTLLIGEILVSQSQSFFWIAGNQSTLRTTGLPIQQVGVGNWDSGGIRTSTPYGLFSDPPQITYEMLESLMIKRSEEAMTADEAIAELAMRSDVMSEADRPSATLFPSPLIGKRVSSAQPLGSTHLSQIHAALADGRVATIDVSIDTTLFAQLGIRNDHRPLEKPLVQTQ